MGAPSSKPDGRNLLVALLVLGVMLLLSGVGVGAWVGWQVWGTNYTAAAQHRATVAELQEQWKKHPGAPVSRIPGDGSGQRETNPDAYGTPFAIMRIPRFGSGWVQPVVQGANLDELAAGVGHVAGSAMPGQVGNMAVAGHRTTHDKPFNQIAQLRPGDLITVETSTAVYTYRVVNHQIVKPTDVQVFAPVPNKPGQTPTQAWLSMSSCHPMWSAKQRYVVHALLVSATAKKG